MRKRRTFAIGGVLLFGALVLVLSLGSSVGASVVPGGASSPRSGSDAGAAAQPGLSAGKVEVGHSSKNDVSPRLSSITPLVVTPGPNKQAVASPRIGHQRSARHDSVVQTKLSAPSMPSTGLNFDGIAFPGVNCNCAPPDTNGEVGATQYVQIVNEGLQVFNKATGASVLGPIDIQTLWSGFGGVCQSNGEGDPVVLSPPTSASRSRPRATRPARSTATTSTSGPSSATTSTTTRSSACGRTPTT